VRLDRIPPRSDPAGVGERAGPRPGLAKEAHGLAVGLRAARAGEDVSYLALDKKLLERDGARRPGSDSFAQDRVPWSAVIGASLPCSLIACRSTPAALAGVALENMPYPIMKRDASSPCVMGHLPSGSSARPVTTPGWSAPARTPPTGRASRACPFYSPCRAPPVYCVSCGATGPGFPRVDLVAVAPTLHVLRPTAPCGPHAAGSLFSFCPACPAP